MCTELDMPNNAFKPKLHRYAASMAGTAAMLPAMRCNSA
jgi:hypothetical protein